MLSSTDDTRQDTHWDEDSRYRRCNHPVPITFADQRIDYIRSWLDVDGIQNALDVGCGNGLSMYRLLGHVPKLFGVDRSAHMLAGHPFRNPCRVALADGRSLPFADGAFDLVYGWEVLHHISDPVRVVEEAVRVTRRWILFAEPNRRNPLQFAYALYDREHRWVLNYSLSFLRGLVDQAGATVTHASQACWIFPNVTPIALAPLLKRLPIRSSFAISNWVAGEKVSR